MANVTYSSFWGPGVDAYSLINGRMPTRTRIKRIVNRDGFRQLTALFNALVGAAAGGTATATHARVQANAPFAVSGGARTVETFTDINRVTTAADIAALKELVYGVTARPVPYPRDLSGNGGPALA